MKKLLYRVQRRAISSVLAMSMAFGVCYGAFPKTKQVSANVVNTESVVDDGVINYVSIGDSMTNGYCLNGYGNNGYMMSGDLSYPELFADWLVDEGYAETVNHSAMAISAMRPEDLQFALELDYTNADDLAFITQDIGNTTLSEKWVDGVGAEWRERFGDAGDAYTWDEFTDNRFSTVQNPFTTGLTEQKKVAKTAEEIQTAVTDADIISICLGNANFGVFLFGRLMNAVEFMGGQKAYDAWIPYEVANMEVDPQVEEFAQTAIDMLKEEVGFQLAAEDQELLDYAILLTKYTVASYMMSMKASVERIVEMNPDVEIMFMGLINGMSGVELKLEDGSTLPIGDYLQVLYDVVNNYVAALPTILKLQDKDTYSQAKFYYAEAGSMDMIVDTFAGLRDANWGVYEGLDGAIVRNRFIVEYNDTLYPMLKGLINPLVSSYGLELKKLDETEANGTAKLAEYEQFAKAWDAYVAGDIAEEPTTSFTPSELLSYAVYLAMEEITIAGASADLSVGGLMKLINGLDEVFGEVTGILNPEALVDLVAIEAMITEDLYNTFVAWATSVDGQTAIMTWATTAEGQTAIGTWMASEGVADPNAVPVEVYALLYSESTEGQAKIAQITNENLPTLTQKYASRFAGAGIVNTLPTALKGNDTIMCLFNLYARCMAGDGMGGHPSATAHNELFNKMTAAYAEGYTTEDKVVDTAETAAKYLAELAKQYGPEIAEKVYAYAVEQGYVAYAEDLVNDVNVEYVALKAELTALKDELIAGANLMGSVLVNEVNATVKCIDEQITTIDALIAQLPCIADEFVKGIATALYNRDAAQVEVCLNKFNAQLNDSKVGVEKAVAAVEARCLDSKANILAAASEVEVSVKPKYLAVVARIETAVANVKAIVVAIENTIDYNKVVDTAEVAAKYLAELANKYGPAVAAIAYQYALEQGYVAYAENLVKDVKAEYLALKSELTALKAELIAHANVMVPVLVNEVNATIACIDEQIATVDALIAQVPGIAEEFVTEVATALYNQATYQVQICVNELNAQLVVLNAEAEKAVAAVEAKYLELKPVILAEVANAQFAVKAKYLAVVAKVETTVAEAKEIIALIENNTELVYQAAYDLYLGGYVVKHEYTEGEELSYLAIGDAVVDGYVNKVAEAWGVNAASINNAGDVAELLAMLNDPASIEAIANADVISVGVTNNAIMDFVLSQVKAFIKFEGTYVELDWASLVTEEGAVYVQKALDAVSAKLVEADLQNIPGVPVSTADVLTVAIENYVYKYLEFTLGYYKVADSIATINPDASILLVGMYNPFKGLVVNGLDIGGYVDDMIDIMGWQYTAYAWLNSNVAYVNISDVAPNATYENYIYDFVKILFGIDETLLLPTADSYDYIAEQIANAVEFVEVKAPVVEPEPPVHVHNYVVNYDENNHWLECECGDVRDVEAHEFDADGKCECGYETEVETPVDPEPPHEHDFTVKYDADNHWLECECSEKKDYEEHTFDADGKCACGYQKEVETPVDPQPPVDPEDPVEPEDPTDPEQPKDEEDGLSVGGIVGIVLGSATVAGAGGFSVVWFFVKKKSGAELIGAVKNVAKASGAAVKTAAKASGAAVKSAAKASGAAVKTGYGKTVNAVKKLFRK